MQKHPLDILADAFGWDAVEGLLDAAARIEAAHLPSFSNRSALQLFKPPTDQQSGDAERWYVTNSELAPQCTDATAMARRSRCACSVHVGRTLQRNVLEKLKDRHSLI